MSEYSKAFVVGGWSESHNFLAGLTREITEGPHRIVDEAEPVTLAEALGNEDSYNAEAKRRVVVAHSAGIMAIHTAGIVVTLNGVEPTPLYKTIWGGVRVATNFQIGYDEQTADKPTAVDGFIEVVRNPRTVSIPWQVRHFSTAGKLIEHSPKFPGGRVYLATDKDEFGFGSRGEAGLVQQSGGVARMLDGWHNQLLQYPRFGAEQIERALNEIN